LHPAAEAVEADAHLAAAIAQRKRGNASDNVGKVIVMVWRMVNAVAPAAPDAAENGHGEARGLSGFSENPVCTENLDSDVLMMQPADQGMRHNSLPLVRLNGRSLLEPLGEALC
jgi:hypothetical protein